MPRRSFPFFLRVASLLFPLAPVCEGGASAQAGAADGSYSTIQATPAPALHLFLGPDGNACGITLPSAKPAGKALHKPGLIVWLHGGMRGQNREKGLEAHRALLPFVAPSGYYLCSPSAFGGEEWPTPQGIAHIDALIDYIAAHYDFDAKDINLVGVSDGNLGVIAYSLLGKRELHRRVLISSAPQLVLPLEALPGQTRFASGSWDFLQGGRDRLFPADQVIPYLKRWEAVYQNAHLHYFPEGEHDFSFYSENAAGLLKGLLSQEKAKSQGGSTSQAKPKKTQAIQKTAPGN
jgi:hypothetical protein